MRGGDQEIIALETRKILYSPLRRTSSFLLSSIYPFAKFYKSRNLI